MTIFLRLLTDKDKESKLQASCKALRANADNPRVYQLAPDSFRAVPGAPFAYWVSDAVRMVFKRLPSFESKTRSARQGLATADDFRFVRVFWESKTGDKKWIGFAKGGSYSQYFADVYLIINWDNLGREINTFSGSVIRNPDYYLRPGLTWPRRTNGLSFRVIPRGCIFADKGPSAFVAGDNSNTLLSLCAILNSKAFGMLVSVQLARTELAQSFEVGLIQQTPVPEIDSEQETALSALSHRAWSLKRMLDSIKETSHAFFLPAALRDRLCDFDPPTIEAELRKTQEMVDCIAFDLYDFASAERTAARDGNGDAIEVDAEGIATPDDDAEDERIFSPLDQNDGLLSWALGVAFGRFDWRLATGEREAPQEPGPFDPLPAKSPGMLPDGAAPFHVHNGILVDDSGHLHDLSRLIEEVLVRVAAEVPGDVRHWLQRDFFPLHLKQYSKSRRKAPIYWPLSTNSGTYTLWLYYPDLTSQTLYSAVNDFMEPKLKQVSREADALRNKGAARSRDDEKALEALQFLELELIELRDTLLQIAPTYHPNHDDGVQITAAPLWQLFRHKPWQKILKDTWAKLEKGEYDWAHLAMAYWPDRVREKCKTDRSLAIAHDLEALYIEPEPRSPKSGKLKKDAE